MLDILPQLISWNRQPNPIVLATVVKTWGSAPRKVGAAMAISANMDMLGSVSGGCVEGAVIQEAKSIFKTRDRKILEFGVSDDDAWSVGLSCGGKLEVYVEPFLTSENNPVYQKIWERIQQAIQLNTGAVWLSKMNEKAPHHTLILPDETVIGDAIPQVLVITALEAFKQRKNQVLTWEEESYFAHVFPRKSQIILIGAAHISSALIELAHQFNFETLVIDPRGVFTQKTHFPIAPDKQYESWPEEILPQLTLDAYTFAVLLTHDPKIDDQALHILLQSEIAYIGALGGKKTQQKRRERLKAAGFEDKAIQRIYGPVGLDIHAQTAQEIALSILAQIIQVQNQYF